jgi:adenylate cyclase
MPSRMSSREFFSLLETRRTSEGDGLDRLIDRRCGEELAILVSDSSGFTRRTHEEGILPALAAVRRAYALCSPIIGRRGGTVISQRADNLLAVFEEVGAAVRAAVEIQQCFRKRKGDGLGLCLGIDVGRVIRLAEDVYGAPVNIASKLGEDLAGRDEILVTAEVARRVRGRVRVAYSRSSEVGGRSLELYRVIVPRR